MLESMQEQAAKIGKIETYARTLTSGGGINGWWKKTRKKRKERKMKLSW